MRISTYFIILLSILASFFAKAQSDCKYLKGATKLEQLMPPSCYGATDGRFSVKTEVQGSGMGGNVSPTYYLGNSTIMNQTAGLFSDNGTGTYRIIVINTFDQCRDTLFIFMPQPDSLKIGVKIDTALCDKPGSFTVNVSGGIPPYKVSWLLPATPGNTINNVETEQSRTVRVIDANNCAKDLTIKMPKAKPLDVTTSIKAATCFGKPTGNIYLYPQNGVAPYTYKWNGPGNVSSITADKLTNIESGIYAVTVNDGKICSYVNSFRVEDGIPIVIDAKVTTASCETTTDGAICLKISGGMPPYSYFWSTGATTACIAKLTGGQYKPIITDAKGCTKDTTIKVSLLYPYTTTKAAVNTRCHDTSDGEATITPIGGTSPFTYLWSDAKKQINANAKDLAEGTYNVTTTDAYGCVHIDTVSIGKPLPLTINPQTTSAKCHDSQDGGASAVVAGGNGNYLIKWCDGFFGVSRNNLAGGACGVTVTDDKGCMAKKDVVVPAPDALKITSIIATNAKCFGEANGSATCVVTGGTTNYSYKWNDPNAQILATANNLSKGTYKVIVTDKNNCSVEGSAEVKEPTALKISTAHQSPRCFGDVNGSFSVTVNGGTTDYNYQWSNGTTTGSTYSSTTASAGFYKVTVTDANLCEVTDTFRIIDPTALVLTLAQTKKGCAGANDNILKVNTLSGGTPNYKLFWSNKQTAETITNLAVGNYSLTVTDGNKCTITEKLDVTELDSIKADLAFVTPTCFGSKDGQVAVTAVSGGAGGGNINNYDYFWDLKPLQLTFNASDLVGNKTYPVVITDSLGCKGVASKFLPQPNPIVLKTTVTNIKCNGEKNGTAEVKATGDNPNFTYQWNDINNQTVAKVTNLKAGTYEVLVNDDKNCSASAKITIVEPGPMLISSKIVLDNKCNGDKNGSIEIKIEGGALPYQYNWTNNDKTAKATKLGVGTYTVTVSDASACSISESFNIKEPQAMQIALDVTDVSCYELKDGTIAVTPKGGTNPYYYSVNGGAFNGFAKIVGLRAGAYEVLVKDALGCIVSETAAVGQPQKFEVTALDDTSVSLGQEAKLKAIYKNNEGKVTFNWVAPSNDILSCTSCADITVKTNITASIILYAKDANGCKAEDIVTVFVKREKSVFVPTGFSPNGDSENDKLLVHSAKNDTKIKIFRIYDRWGELLFEAQNFLANDKNVGWDGSFRDTNMPSGSYVWFVEVEYPTGETDIERGSTTLIR
jgi:gliding motility-associated-like protein